MPTALVTGISGYVGAALVPRLQDAGLDVRGFARDPRRVTVDVPVVQGDATTGAGFAEALDGVDVAYYLIHSMETHAGGGGFADLERASAEHFAKAAQAAGVRRVAYLGGPVPEGVPSRHLGSRHAVEEVLLDAAPETVALRASIVIGARSRSFRFLVRLVERFRVLALPAWHAHRTAPIDERDVLALLAAAGTAPDVEGALSLDAVGPEVLSYGSIMERIRDLMLLGRPRINIPLSMTPVAAAVAAKVGDEDIGLVEPLMESLDADLLPREGLDASDRFDVRIHTFDAAVEHALRVWEADEEIAAR